RHELGHCEHRDRPAIVARCYRGGEVVTEAYRNAEDEPYKDLLLPGRPVGWIERMPPERGGVLLCAGFFDSIIARQHELPAISAPGSNLPDHLIPDLAGRRVAVCYDVGE